MPRGSNAATQEKQSWKAAAVALKIKAKMLRLIDGALV